MTDSTRPASLCRSISPVRRPLNAPLTLESPQPNQGSKGRNLQLYKPNEPHLRYTLRNTSCTNSSASPEARRTCRPISNTILEYRSKIRARASRSPACNLSMRTYIFAVVFLPHRAGSLASPLKFHARARNRTRVGKDELVSLWWLD